MLYPFFARVIKLQSRMALLKTIRRQISEVDRKEADENIQVMKRHREKLREVRRRMVDLEKELEESICVLEQHAAVLDKTKRKKDETSDECE